MNILTGRTGVLIGRLGRRCHAHHTASGDGDDDDDDS